MSSKELIPSVLFEDDEKYERHLRNSISILDGCVNRDEDVLIEAPMATRVLLDFYCETLRRFIKYDKKETDSEG